MTKTIRARGYLPDTDVGEAAPPAVIAAVELAPPPRERRAVCGDITGMPNRQGDQHELRLRGLGTPRLEGSAKPRPQALRPGPLTCPAHEVLATRVPPHPATPRALALHHDAARRALRQLRGIRPFNRHDAPLRVGSTPERQAFIRRSTFPTRQGAAHAIPVAPFGHLLRFRAR